MGLTGAIVMKGADPDGKAMMREEIKGVGDEAISGPLLSLFMFRKGDVSVQVDARLLPRRTRRANCHRQTNHLEVVIVKKAF